MGTDTDTQFLMSSDSGSKVQVGRSKIFSVECRRVGWREREAGKVDEETERNGERGDERSCNKAWFGKNAFASQAGSCIARFPFPPYEVDWRI